MNYYQILGVSENASQQEIKIQFRKLALQYHPDRTNHENDHHFKLVNEAYQVLSDPLKKTAYDYRLKYQGNYFKNTSFNYAAAQEQARQEKIKADKQKAFYEAQLHKAKIKEDKRFIRQMIITVSLFVIILGGTIIHSYVKEERIKIEQKKTQIFVQNEVRTSKNLIKEGQYEQAISQLAETYKKHSFNDYLKEESNQIIDDLLYTARFEFQQNNFEKSLKIYTALQPYTPLEAEYVYEMACCYRYLANFQKSIDFLKNLIQTDYAHYKYFYDIASILDLDLNKKEEAIIYYEKASDIIIENYHAIYGQAYIVTLNPNKLPKEHFAVFYDKAMNYYHLKNYEKALGALKWANNLQRENDISLYYQGVCLYELKQKTEACDCWKQAYTFNEREQILTKITQFCK